MSKQPKLDSFLKAKKASLRQVVTELIACDGIPFYALSKSDVFSTQGYNLQKTTRYLRSGHETI